MNPLTDPIKVRFKRRDPDPGVCTLLRMNKESNYATVRCPETHFEYAVALSDLELVEEEHGNPDEPAWATVDSCSEDDDPMIVFGIQGPPSCKLSVQCSRLTLFADTHDCNTVRVAGATPSMLRVPNGCMRVLLEARQRWLNKPGPWARQDQKPQKPHDIRAILTSCSAHIDARIEFVLETQNRVQSIVRTTSALMTLGVCEDGQCYVTVRQRPGVRFLISDADQRILRAAEQRLNENIKRFRVGG